MKAKNVRLVLLVLTAVLGFDAVQLAIGITPIAASFVIVAPVAGHMVNRIGSDRLAAGGYVVAASGALWMALAAGPELDQVERLARVELEHVPDAIGKAERVRRLLGEAVSAQPLVLGTRGLEGAFVVGP